MKSEVRTSPGEKDRSGFRWQAVFSDFKRIANLARDAVVTEERSVRGRMAGFPFLLALAGGRVLTLGNNQSARSL